MVGGWVTIWRYEPYDICCPPQSGVYANAHVLGLRSDGVVEAWGNNYEGQCDLPKSSVRMR